MTREVKGVENIEKVSLLYDFYGGLLTAKQNEVMSLYHEENYSLGEIAGEFGISRQAVHNTLKAAEMSLMTYEEKLGLVNKMMKSRGAISEIDELIESLLEGDFEGKDKEKLRKVKAIIDKIED